MSPKLQEELVAAYDTPTAYEARLSGDWRQIMAHLEGGGTLSDLSARHREILKTSRDEGRNPVAAWERYHREIEDEFNAALKAALRNTDDRPVEAQES